MKNLMWKTLKKQYEELSVDLDEIKRLYPDKILWYLLTMVTRMLKKGDPSILKRVLTTNNVSVMSLNVFCMVNRCLLFTPDRIIGLMRSCEVAFFKREILEFGPKRRREERKWKHGRRRRSKASKE